MCYNVTVARDDRSLCVERSVVPCQNSADAKHFLVKVQLKNTISTMMSAFIISKGSLQTVLWVLSQ